MARLTIKLIALIGISLAASTCLIALLLVTVDWIIYRGMLLTLLTHGEWMGALLTICGALALGYAACLGTGQMLADIHYYWLRYRRALARRRIGNRLELLMQPAPRVSRLDETRIVRLVKR